MRVCIACIAGSGGALRTAVKRYYIFVPVLYSKHDCCCGFVIYLRLGADVELVDLCAIRQARMFIICVPVSTRSRSAIQDAWLFPTLTC